MRHTSRNSFRLGVETLESRDVPAGDLVATGADAGGEPEVRLLNPDGSVQRSFLAYDANFRGGVRVAVGDVTGDGVSDVVTAPGAGGGPQVKVFDGVTGNEAYSFFAYDPTFLGGVSIAVGHRSGRPVIVTGAGIGGGPQVNLFDGPTARPLLALQAYAASFQGGVNVAYGDLYGDGVGAIITAAGPGGGPQVNIFDPTSAKLKQSFMAYAPSFRGGVSVASGDVAGLGHDQIITGAGPGGGPQVNIFDATSGQIVKSYFPYDPTFTGGVSVSVIPGPSGERDLLVTAPGPGGGPDVRVYSLPANNYYQPSVVSNFFAYNPLFTGGLAFGSGYGLWRPYWPVYSGYFTSLRMFSYPTAGYTTGLSYGAGYDNYWQSYNSPIYQQAAPAATVSPGPLVETDPRAYFNDNSFDTPSNFDPGVSNSYSNDWATSDYGSSGWADSGWWDNGGFDWGDGGFDW